MKRSKKETANMEIYEVIEEKLIEVEKQKREISKKKGNKKGIKNWVIVLLTILDLGAISCLVLAYGPYTEFKNFLITTAMSTMNHKYLARTIYNEETINQVLRQNTIVEITEETDTDAIVIGSYETDYYESEYEEQILKKDEGNDDYKIFSFKEGGKTYYITVVYDPSRISLAVAPKLGSKGLTVKDHVKRNNALVGINAGGFEDPKGVGNGARPTGIVISNGKVVWKGISTHWGKGLIGFNKDHKLVLTRESADTAIKNGMVDAVTFGPFLIVNGKEAQVKGLGGGVHPRTIIAQRKDGIVLFITIDGNGNRSGYRGGASFKEVLEVLKRYKVYNAANLDGGASAILVEGNKIVNNPVGYGSTGERWHPNAWIVK